MTIISSYKTIATGTRGIYEPLEVVPPLLQWLTLRIEQRAQFITGAGSPGVSLGTITMESFTRLYMVSVSLDWDPLHTINTLLPGRDIFSLWVNIAPKERPNATLIKLGVDRAGFYRFHFDTSVCITQNKCDPRVWGVYVPHINNEKTLKPFATWGGLVQRYIEFLHYPPLHTALDTLLGGSNE